MVLNIAPIKRKVDQVQQEKLKKSEKKEQRDTISERENYHCRVYALIKANKWIVSVINHEHNQPLKNDPWPMVLTRDFTV